MSGTLGNLQAVGGGLALPSPVIRLSRNRAGFVPSVSDGSPQNNSLIQVNTVNLASVSVHGLPLAVLEDLSAYQPQLELMRYVGIRSSAGVIPNRNFRSSGYVHPAHGPGPSGNGSHTHGGGLGGFAALNAVRPTEWPALAQGQVIDVTQGIYGFMEYISSMLYRDAAGNQALFAGVTSSASRSNWGHGKRFPYAGRYSPGYFAFRWSIKDPTDDRSQRITGPLSKVLSVANERFPVNPVPMVAGRACGEIAPGYDSRTCQMWIGSVSRLPR